MIKPIFICKFPAFHFHSQEEWEQMENTYRSILKEYHVIFVEDARIKTTIFELHSCNGSTSNIYNNES